MRKFVLLLMVLGLAAPASAATIDLGPGVNNGSFETTSFAPTAWTRPHLPGWWPSSGGLMSNIYTVPNSLGYGPDATDGVHKIQPGQGNGQIISLGFAATETGAATVSADFGWDGRGAESPNWNGYTGQVVELWEYDPGTFSSVNLLVTLISDPADPTSVPTGAGAVAGTPGWITLSGSAPRIDPSLQLSVRAYPLGGQYSWSHLLDNFVVTTTPEPVTLGLLGLGGLELIRRRRRT